MVAVQSRIVALLSYATYAMLCALCFAPPQGLVRGTSTLGGRVAAASCFVGDKQALGRCSVCGGSSQGFVLLLCRRAWL